MNFNDKNKKILEIKFKFIDKIIINYLINQLFFNFIYLFFIFIDYIINFDIIIFYLNNFIIYD